MSFLSTPLIQKGKKDKAAIRALTAEEVDEIKYAFDLFDQDRKAWIRPREVKVALRALGFAVKKRDLALLLSDIVGADDVQQVDFDSFKSVLAVQLTRRQPNDGHERAFDLLDLDKQGFIDFKTLKRVVKVRVYS
jgi:centrin-3